MSRRTLAWLVIALAAGLLCFARWPQRALGVRPPADEALAPEGNALAALAPAEVTRIPLAAPPTDPVHVVTAREYLRDYYGARWAELEPRIKARGLDEPFVLTPWEDVEEEFSRQVAIDPEHRAAMIWNQLRWTHELTPAWLHEQYPVLGWNGALEESELRAIEELVEPLHEEIRMRAEWIADRTDSYLQEMWQRGTYLRAPFTTMGLSDKRGYHSQSIGGHGWAVTFTLTHEECPDIQPMEDEIRALCEKRDLAVIDFLRRR